MKTHKNYQSPFHDGDSCKVNSKLNYEEHLIEDHPKKLIEDHPQHLIEDHPQNLIEDHPAKAAAFAAAPVETEAVGAPIAGGGKSSWWAWCLAGLVGLFIVGLGLYFGLRKDHAGIKGEQYAYVSQNKGSGQAVGTDGVNVVAAPGNVEDYVYYFGNDKSAVVDNSRLKQVADKIEETGADVVVTAYASQVGNEVYNKNLSEKRADNIADYLVAHGVPVDHVKVVSNGETTNYGDEAHNRRANIHVVYPG